MGLRPADPCGPLSVFPNTPLNNAITFSSKRHACCSLLAEIAEDLLTAPASQAFVERIFSLYGWLTTGKGTDK
jgi:hypothetical protein